MSGALPWIGSYKKGNCDLLGLEVLFVLRPEMLADGNIPNELDIIAASSLAAGHLTLVPKLRDELDNKGRSEIHIIVGGVIPKEDLLNYEL